MSTPTETIELMLALAFVAGFIASDITFRVTRWVLRKAKGVRRG